MMKDIKIFKVTSLPTSPEPNSIYFIPKSANEVDIFVTSISGVPRIVPRGEIGPQGPQGMQGPVGPQGEIGLGVPDPIGQDNNLIPVTSDDNYNLSRVADQPGFLDIPNNRDYVFDNFQRANENPLSLSTSGHSYIELLGLSSLSLVDNIAAPASTNASFIDISSFSYGNTNVTAEALFDYMSVADCGFIFLQDETNYIRIVVDRTYYYCYHVLNGISTLLSSYKYLNVSIGRATGFGKFRVHVQPSEQYAWVESTWGWNSQLSFSSAVSAGFNSINYVGLYSQSQPIHKWYAYRD